MKDQTTIRELLQRIAALAERGATEGERQAAQQQLDRLLKKYGLQLADVVSVEQREQQYFRYRDDWEWRLFRQLSAHVTGEERDTWYNPQSKRRVNKERWIDLTAAEFVEISALYVHYRAAFAAQLDDYMRAFIHANDLLQRVAAGSLRPLSREERERLKRIMGMAAAIEPTPAARSKNLLTSKG